MVYEMTFRSRRKNMGVQYAGPRLCKTRKIPVYPESNWNIRPGDFLDRTHYAPCFHAFFASYEGVVYTASFYFTKRGAPQCLRSELSIRVECVEGACTPASCRYVHKHGGGRAREGEGGCISRHSLLMHSPRYACIFISRHKRIYWLRSLIRISTLRHACDKPAKKEAVQCNYLSLV